MTRIAAFASGSGTNLQAILDNIDAGHLQGIEMNLVVSNRREAYANKRAIQHGIPLVYFPLLPYTKAGRPREDYDAALARIVQSFDVEWIVLAGWMHIFTNAFVRHYPQRIVNLHPALPGAFPGTNSIARAFEAYQRGEIEHTGVMVHLVPDEAVDAGPVVAQARVPIKPTDTVDTLEARIHEAERQLLIQVLKEQVASPA